MQLLSEGIGKNFISSPIPLPLKIQNKEIHISDDRRNRALKVTKNVVCRQFFFIFSHIAVSTHSNNILGLTINKIL